MPSGGQFAEVTTLAEIAEGGRDSDPALIQLDDAL